VAAGTSGRACQCPVVDVVLPLDTGPYRLSPIAGSGTRIGDRRRRLRHRLVSGALLRALARVGPHVIPVAVGGSSRRPAEGIMGRSTRAAVQHGDACGNRVAERALCADRAARVCRLREVQMWPNLATGWMAVCRARRRSSDSCLGPFARHGQHPSSPPSPQRSVNTVVEDHLDAARAVD